MSKELEALDWIENVFEEHRVQLPDIELTLVREALTELEELKRDVKRYFELKAKGITTEAEALEYRELLNEINEMVGIEK